MPKSWPGKISSKDLFASAAFEAREKIDLEQKDMHVCLRIRQLDWEYHDFFITLPKNSTIYRLQHEIAAAQHLSAVSPEDIVIYTSQSNMGHCSSIRSDSEGMSGPSPSCVGVRPTSIQNAQPLSNAQDHGQGLGNVSSDIKDLGVICEDTNATLSFYFSEIAGFYMSTLSQFQRVALVSTDSDLDPTSEKASVDPIIHIYKVTLPTGACGYDYIPSTNHVMYANAKQVEIDLKRTSQSAPKTRSHSGGKIRQNPTGSACGTHSKQPRTYKEGPLTPICGQMSIKYAHNLMHTHTVDNQLSMARHANSPESKLTHRPNANEFQVDSMGVDSHLAWPHEIPISTAATRQTKSMKQGGVVNHQQSSIQTLPGNHHIVRNGVSVNQHNLQKPNTQHNALLITEAPKAVTIYYDIRLNIPKHPQSVVLENHQQMLLQGNLEDPLKVTNMDLLNS
ncbi:hypothetical protein BSLG_009867 [Batrachochytrium salamandrivorans]|nr:hypothetical protein BSLG_009867 [Batrachochytrium salamandrivorans]